MLLQRKTNPQTSGELFSNDWRGGGGGSQTRKGRRLEQISWREFLTREETIIFHIQLYFEADLVSECS